MSQLLTDRDCFACDKAGFKGVKVDMEKVGTKADGKAIWKLYDADTQQEHQHKGSKANYATELKDINMKLDRVLVILNRLTGQGSLDVQGNE